MSRQWLASKLSNDRVSFGLDDWHTAFRGDEVAVSPGEVRWVASDIVDRKVCSDLVECEVCV